MRWKNSFYANAELRSTQLCNRSEFNIRNVIIMEWKVRTEKASALIWVNFWIYNRTRHAGTEKCIQIYVHVCVCVYYIDIHIHIHIHMHTPDPYVFFVCYSFYFYFLSILWLLWLLWFHYNSRMRAHAKIIFVSVEWWIKRKNRRSFTDICIYTYFFFVSVVQKVNGEE